MNKNNIRVRFAPSPTGHLHIGGVRTALFNYLFARHYGGSFTLRIEDTDSSRSTEESIKAIIESMKWLGLEWDEVPYRQTERLNIYSEKAEVLLTEGKAYYCYCTPEELEARRKEALAQGKVPKYDRRCRNLNAPLEGRPRAIRFISSDEGQTVVDDLIRGRVVFENIQLDDLIILRSDGFPTYNFSVVVDDVSMGITHIIRGDDHLNNTPRQIQLYQSLGYETPKFAHIPMILGSDRARLSKRHGATAVMAYKEMGYLPEAMLNYLARLGWSFGDQEIFSKEELIEKFSLENVGKSAAIFNPEKLLWLNSQYIMKTDAEKLAKMVMPFLAREGIIPEGQLVDMKWLSKAVSTFKERAKTLSGLAKSLRFYIVEYVEYNEKAKAKFLNEKSRDLLIELKYNLESLTDFSVLEIERIFRSIIEKHNIKLGSLAQPVRVAITGGTESPGIFEVLEIVGKEKTIKRLDRAIKTIG